MTTANESQVQTPTAEPAQQQMQIGFEKALGMLDPQWRTNMTKEELNKHRHFYHQGIQDLFLLVRISNEQMAQNFQSVLNTVVVTGNEDEIARLKKEHEEQLERAAKPTGPKVAKALKTVPAPAKKAVKKGKK